MFFAGAQLFHTLGHVVIALTHTLPIHIFGWNYTQHTNAYITLVNLAVAVWLVWWAQKTK
jgi:hypothetical protein